MNKLCLGYAFLAFFILCKSVDLCAAPTRLHVPAEVVERIQSDSQTFKDMMQDAPGDDDDTKKEVLDAMLARVPMDDLEALIKYLETNKLPNGLVHLPSLLRAANYLGMMEITELVLPKLTVRLFAKAVMAYFEFPESFARYVTTDYLAKIDRQIIMQILKQNGFPKRLLARLQAWPNFPNELRILQLQIANYLILNQRLVGTQALAHLQAAIDESPILKALHEVLAQENRLEAERQRQRELEFQRQRDMQQRQMLQRQLEYRRQAAVRRQRAQEEARQEAAKRPRPEAEQAFTDPWLADFKFSGMDFDFSNL